MVRPRVDYVFDTRGRAVRAPNKRKFMKNVRENIGRSNLTILLLPFYFLLA